MTTRKFTIEVEVTAEDADALPSPGKFRDLTIDSCQEIFEHEGWVSVETFAAPGFTEFVKPPEGEHAALEWHPFRDEFATCGESVPGQGTALCEYHLKQAETNYPQGWSYYPGDICRHGKYTGGSGIDWMCGPCELGDD